MSNAPAIPVTKGRKGDPSGVGQILRQRLLTGVWQPNDRLPSERELAQELNVCAATIQRYLRELQAEGLIVGRPGKGRFVVGVAQRQRTGNLGVVLFDSRHLAKPGMSRMVAGIGDVAAEQRYGLRIFVGNELWLCENAEQTASHGAGFLGSPSSLGVDGLIVLTQRLSPETIQKLSSMVPVVCSHLLPTPKVCYLVLDTATGAFDATRHLLDLGHRRIALVAKDTTDEVGRAAREGARLAMAGAGLAAQPEGLRMYTASEFAQAEGYRLGKELLAHAPRATAIICSEDTLATGVLQAIDEAGLRVPEDVSVISWNDALLERHPVAITSVCFDMFEAGTRLCRRMLECVEHPERQFEVEYLRPRLVARQSTAAPRAAS